MTDAQRLVAQIIDDYIYGERLIEPTVLSLAIGKRVLGELEACGWRAESAVAATQVHNIQQATIDRLTSDRDALQAKLDAAQQRIEELDGAMLLSDMQSRETLKALTSDDVMHAVFDKMWDRETLDITPSKFREIIQAAIAAAGTAALT